MWYFINLQSWELSNDFRHSTHAGWSLCNNSSIIASQDKVFTEKQLIVDLQVNDIQLQINGHSFDIQSPASDVFPDRNELAYYIYGFRESYPCPPTLAQLRNVLENGDDANENTLLLKTDGLFYLINPSTIIHTILEPGWVLEFNKFNAGDGVAGKPACKIMTMNIFKMAIDKWKNHLLYKELHLCKNVNWRSLKQRNELINTHTDLDSIKYNWEFHRGF